MTPDQTAPEQFDLGQYCLQYKLPMNISRKTADDKTCD